MDHRSVAIVVESFPPDNIGGMETQTKRMATRLHERGHNVTVFTKKYGTHDDTDVEYEVVRVWNLDWTPFLSTLTFLINCLFKLLFRARDFDCLQCMMLYPVGFLGYMTNQLTGLPYFAWIRGGDYYLMKDVRWKRWMMRKVLTDTLVLAQSAEIRDDVESDFSAVDSTIEILGNGVTIPDRTARGDAILYVGRLAPKKGLRYLIEATGDRDEPTTLLVGDGSERERLERLAAEHDAAVEFVGWVDPGELDEYYEQAGIFVLPSIEGEGMPNAVLEAMSWGIPVIATDSGALPSMLSDGETGFVVPTADVNAIKIKLDYLVANPDERERMGENAREYVIQQRSWEMLLDELEQVYARTIDLPVS